MVIRNRLVIITSNSMNKLRVSTLLILILLLFSRASVAQQEYIPEKKEVECLLSFSNFQPITTSLGYKRQIKKQTFLKLALINLKYSESRANRANTTTTSTTRSFNIGFLGGLEFRKSLNQVFTLFHGPGIGVTYFYSKHIYPPSVGNEWYVIAQGVTPEVVYSVGLLAKITQYFYFAAEINPSVSYNQEYIDAKSSASSNSLNNSFAINFGNKNATLSFVYKIH